MYDTDPRTADPQWRPVDERETTHPMKPFLFVGNDARVEVIDQVTPGRREFILNIATAKFETVITLYMAPGVAARIGEGIAARLGLKLLAAGAS